MMRPLRRYEKRENRIYGWDAINYSGKVRNGKLLHMTSMGEYEISRFEALMIANHSPGAVCLKWTEG